MAINTDLDHSLDTSRALLIALRRRGMVLELDGDQLRWRLRQPVRPALMAAMQETLNEHQAELVAALQEDAKRKRQREDAKAHTLERSQLTQDPRPDVGFRSLLWRQLLQIAYSGDPLWFERLQAFRKGGGDLEMRDGVIRLKPGDIVVGSYDAFSVRWRPEGAPLHELTPPPPERCRTCFGTRWSWEARWVCEACYRVA